MPEWVKPQKKIPQPRVWGLYTKTIPCGQSFFLPLAASFNIIAGLAEPKQEEITNSYLVLAG